MFFFVLLINMMRFVSQTTFRQFPSLLLNGTCGSRLRPPSGGVVPEPRASTLPEGGAGGRADRRTKQQARGQPAPGAMCSRPSARPLRRRRLWEAVAWLSGVCPGHSPTPRGSPGTPGSPPPLADGARTSSSSLSSSLDGAAPGSGAGVLASCSCSTRLRRARMRWCRAAYSWPVSLELAWGRQREGPGYKASWGDPSSVDVM